MGFFDRLAFGWRLGTTSLGVVTRDKTLMMFPVLSGITSVLRVAAFVFGSVLGAAWAVITYFVVPVMIFENQAPTTAIGRSVDLMKKTWGENAGAQVGIGLVVFLLIILAVGIGVAGVFLIPQAGMVRVPLAAIFIPVVILLGMAAKAVLAVGLYEFATGAGSKGVFRAEELKAAFR